MTWKELTLKERSKIYKQARALSPDLTYFDIRDIMNNLPKYSNGGVTQEPVEATFGLPEVNIYPQNEFGDIARSQGITTARNWRTVKEGTTKGINDFYNDPRTQLVMAGLPMPSIIDGVADGLKLLKPVIQNTKVGGKVLGAIDNTIDNVADFVDHKFIPKAKRFVEDASTFTRGVGTGETGLQDLVTTGVVRGNPRGGLTTAHNLAKIKKSDSFRNFEELYPDEANRILNNDLRKKDYDLVANYFEKNPIYKNSGITSDIPNNGGIALRKKSVLDDLKKTYPTYEDYLNKKTDYKYADDFYENGDPRAFFFDDGANPGMTGTYPTKYFMKIKNPQVYEPFIPQGHLHYTTRQQIGFYDPNVELYKNMKTFSGETFGKAMKKPTNK